MVYVRVYRHGVWAYVYTWSARPYTTPIHCFHTPCLCTHLYAMSTQMSVRHICAYVHTPCLYTRPYTHFHTCVRAHTHACAHVSLGFSLVGIFVVFVIWPVQVDPRQHGQLHRHGMNTYKGMRVHGHVTISSACPCTHPCTYLCTCVCTCPCARPCKCRCTCPCACRCSAHPYVGRAWLCCRPMQHGRVFLCLDMLIDMTMYTGICMDMCIDMCIAFQTGAACASRSFVRVSPPTGLKVVGKVVLAQVPQVVLH